MIGATRIDLEVTKVPFQNRTGYFYALLKAGKPVMERTSDRLAILRTPRRCSISRAAKQFPSRLSAHQGDRMKADFQPESGSPRPSRARDLVWGAVPGWKFHWFAPANQRNFHPGLCSPRPYGTKACQRTAHCRWRIGFGQQNTFVRLPLGHNALTG